MINLSTLIRILPDKLCIQLLFRKHFGRWPNLKNPRTFNEKLQWLKLYNRQDLYTTLVDKYAVKDFISKKYDPSIIIPTIGIWDSISEIEWDKLPNQFVLKTTHGGGSSGVVVCKDKSTFDKEKACAQLQKSLDKDLYSIYREWPYKNVTKRIIAETYIEDETGELRDYKFYCFNGKAYKVMVCYDRGTGDTKFYSFDREWNLLRHNKRGLMAPKDFTLPKPQKVDAMFDLADELSKDIPFVRVDLYNVNGKIYFGELTLFPNSGLDGNILPSTDELYGSMIVLPNK